MQSAALTAAPIEPHENWLFAYGQVSGGDSLKLLEAIYAFQAPLMLSGVCILPMGGAVWVTKHVGPVGRLVALK